MSALDTVLDVVKAAAPSVAGLVLPPPIGSIAEKLIRSVVGDDDSISVEAAAARIAANPELMVKLRQAAAMEEAQYQETMRRQISEVNQTMRAEIMSQGLWKSGWRPYIGWCFGTALLATVGLCLWLGFKSVAANNPALIGQIGALVGALMPIFGVFAAVVGVAVHGRNKDKQAALGREAGPGMIASLVNALKGGW